MTSGVVAFTERKIIADATDTAVSTSTDNPIPTAVERSSNSAETTTVDDGGESKTEARDGIFWVSNFSELQSEFSMIRLYYYFDLVA